MSIRLMALAAVPVIILAQANPPPVQTYPIPGTTANGNASNTITVTNTFQSVFSTSLNRRGCTIQNNGANTMWVEEGVTVAAATKGNSVAIAVGVPYYCGYNGLVLTGPIVITGTAGDAFYAAQY